MVEKMSIAVGATVRRRLSSVLVAAMVSFLLVPIPSAAAAPFSLSGTVSDVSVPLEDATVEVLVLGTETVVIAATTDVAGAYSLVVEEGTYDVRFTPPAGSELAVSTVQGQVISENTTLNVVLTDPPPPPPPDPITITGTLRDDAGNPLDGITVGVGGVPGLVPFVSEDVTASDGSYELVDAPAETNVLFVLYGGGFIAGTYDLDVDTDLDLTVSLVEVAVTVTDPLGTPVSGAGVSGSVGATGFPPTVVSTSPLFTGAVGSFGAMSATAAPTDAAGVTSLRLLQSPDGAASVLASAPLGVELDPGSNPAVPLVADSAITIALTDPQPPPPPPVTITGVLRDGGGTPLAGVTVGAGGIPGLTPFAQQDVTAVDGSYSLVDVPVGTGLLVVVYEGGFVLDTYDFAATAILDLTIHLVDVTVTVTDTLTAPVAGATVSGVVGAGGFPPSTVSTPPLFPGATNSVGLLGPVEAVADASGIATVSLLESSDGTGTVTAIAPVGLDLEATSVAVDLNAPTSVTLVLPQSPPPPPPPEFVTVSGVLRDDDGTPLADVPISAGGAPPLIPPDASTVTGADGSYSLDDVPIGQKPVFVSYGGGFVFAVYDFATDAALDLTVHLVDVDVTVTDSQGNPVPGATVWGSVGGQGFPPDLVDTPPLFSGVSDSRGQMNDTALTDAAGVATVRLLESRAGEASVSVGPPDGTNLSSVTVSAVPLAADYAVTVLIASMQGSLATGGEALGGQIVELSPGASGARRTALREAAGGDSTVTEPDGTYSLTVDPGLYDLTVRNGESANVAAPDSYSVTADGLDVTSARSDSLHLPVSSVSVTVEDGSGEPVPGAVVSMACTPTSFELISGGPASGSTCDSAVSDASGVAVLKVLPVADLTLDVVPPGGSGLVESSVSFGEVSADLSATVELSSPVVAPGVGSIVEGDSGSAVLTIPVTLSGRFDDVVTIDWTTLDTGARGIAASGIDYLADSGSVSFAPGATEQFVEIEVFGDLIDEPDLLYGEWLLVAFSNPSSSATLDLSQFGLGIGVIVDDDPPPVIKPGVVAVTEPVDGEVVVEVPLTLSNPSAEPVTVDWATLDNGAVGIATAGVDYAAGSGTVTFAPGETAQSIELSVVGDELVEEPLVYGEWALVAFSNPSANATLDLALFGLGVVIILDN